MEKGNRRFPLIVLFLVLAPSPPPPNKLKRQACVSTQREERLIEKKVVGTVVALLAATGGECLAHYSPTKEIRFRISLSPYREEVGTNKDDISELNMSAVPQAESNLS
jgi:hypothetical protein